MTIVVGVHGIAQQQFGRKQLLRDWGPALTDGLSLAYEAPVIDPPFDLAFYGDVFLKRYDTEKGAEKTPASDDLELDDVSEAEVAELLELAADAVTAEEVAAAEKLPPTMAYTRTPRAVQAVLRAIDAKFGAAAGMLYIGTLRQVRRYLVEPGWKPKIDNIVDLGIAPDCRVLVGHSLGSVIAFEYLRRHPEHYVDLFLTVGSPLGLRMVRSGMPDASWGASTDSGVPANVARWVNIRDPRDPVTCAGDLHRFWPGIIDRLVDNAGDAHNIARYLSKVETGHAVLDAAPQLGVLDKR